MPRNCLTCNEVLAKTHQKQYCSHTCARQVQYKNFLAKWLSGEEDAVRDSGMRTSKYVRKWLIETYGEKCAECGWNKTNIHTGKIPVQIDHIDGNPLNNNSANLRFLCPSCHSLTPTFGAANRGNGREIRRNRYKRRGSSKVEQFPRKEEVVGSSPIHGSSRNLGSNPSRSLNDPD